MFLNMRWWIKNWTRLLETSPNLAESTLPPRTAAAGSVPFPCFAIADYSIPHSFRLLFRAVFSFARFLVLSPEYSLSVSVPVIAILFSALVSFFKSWYKSAGGVNDRVRAGTWYIHASNCITVYYIYRYLTGLTVLQISFPFHRKYLFWERNYMEHILIFENYSCDISKRKMKVSIQDSWKTDLSNFISGYWGFLICLKPGILIVFVQINNISAWNLDFRKLFTSHFYSTAERPIYVMLFRGYWEFLIFLKPGSW
jgi:hypothetical protein